MKSNDTIKIIVAVVLLAVAGIVIVMQFSGGTPDRDGTGPGDTFEIPDDEPDPDRPTMMRPVED